MVNLPGSWVEHGSHILQFQRVALWQLWRNEPEEHSSYTAGGSSHRARKENNPRDSVHGIDYCFFLGPLVSASLVGACESLVLQQTVLLARGDMWGGARAKNRACTALLPRRGRAGCKATERQSLSYRICAFLKDRCKNSSTTPAQDFCCLTFLPCNSRINGVSTVVHLFVASLAYCSLFFLFFTWLTNSCHCTRPILVD